MAKASVITALCVVFGNYESTGMAAMEFFRVKMSSADYANGEHYDHLRTLVTDREKFKDQYNDNNIVIFDDNDARDAGFVFNKEHETMATAITI